MIVDTDREFSIKNVALFKTCGNPILARFILYYLQSGLLDIQIALLSKGGAQGFLGLGQIRNLIIELDFKKPVRSVRERQLTHFLPDSICVLPYRYICINFFEIVLDRYFFVEAD